LQLKNFNFHAAGIDSIRNGTNILQLIGNSKWTMQGDGLSYLTKDKMYRVTVGPFKFDKVRSTVNVKELSLLSMLTRAGFVQGLKTQKDHFNLRFRNIIASGVDLEKLLSDQTIIAAKVTLQPVLQIFNDRTVAPSTESKVGTYPHQALQKLKNAVDIRTLLIRQGEVVYTERGAITKEIGDVAFYAVNAEVSNITNMADRIKDNPVMVLKAQTKFLKHIDIRTEWKLNLASTDGSFTASGSASTFSAPLLNSVLEPLGPASIERGKINKLEFNIIGTDLKGRGNVNLLYTDLKVKLLKPSDKDPKKMERKGVTSFVANLLIRDKNPAGGNLRKGPVEYDRVITKSFFNLIWKSIFNGAKKTLM
jgi:hypothetical protein